MDLLILKTLAKQLNLTNPEDEQEEDILTPEEKQSILEHEIISLKKHKIWKMREKGLSEETALLKVSEINLFEQIDEVEILKRANSNKHYSIWQKEQRAKEYELEVQKKIELKQRCTAKYMYNLLAWTSKNVYGKNLIVNDNTIPLIKSFCLFLSRDGKFLETPGFSFSKGLFVRGISGLGKTYMAECLQHNELNPMLIYSMIEIAEIIKTEGEFQLPVDSNKTIYLDDVGTEPEIVNHYGTKINFFKNFIETYYLNKKSFNKLIISTNSSFKEIEEKYGFRVRSRLRGDMMNVIDVTGEDLRGK